MTVYNSRYTLRHDYFSTLTQCGNNSDEESYLHRSTYTNGSLPVPTVIYNRIGRFEIKAGTTILEASKSLNLFHPHGCGGKAECSTCRVWILAGENNCSPMQENERGLLAEKNLRRPIRLACQTKIQGPVRLQILLRDRDDVAQVMQPREFGGSELPGAEMAVAILSLAVQSFEAFATENTAYETLHVWNKALATIERLVVSHGGRLQERSGTTLRAIFGMEGKIETAITSAVKCAQGVGLAFDELNEYLEQHFDIELQLRTAVHAGMAKVGSRCEQGFESLLAFGEAIEFANHLLHLANEAETELLISEPVFAVIRDHANITRAFSARMPGKEDRCHVFEIARQEVHEIQNVSEDTAAHLIVD